MGTLSVANDQVSVSGVGGEVKNIPTKDAAYLVNGDDFQKAISHEPGLLHGWAGGVTLGATLVESTQTSETLTGAIDLVRTQPSVDWLQPRNKTIFDATATYGLLTQPFIAGVQAASSAKTNILHGDIERDRISDAALLLPLSTQAPITISAPACRYSRSTAPEPAIRSSRRRRGRST